MSGQQLARAIWRTRRVLNFAHQGGALEGPSSTLYACEQAVANGADVLELDLHATSDGVVVVCHDATVEATANGSGAIAQLPYEALRRLDNAYFFVPGKGAVKDEAPAAYPYRGRGPADARFSFVRLEEVLASFPNVLVNLDIKQGAPAVAPYEAAVAKILQAYGRRDDVIVTSFYDEVVARFSACAPEIGTAPGTSELTAFLGGLRRGEDVALFSPCHVAIQMPARYGGVWLVDERTVEHSHRLGCALHVWTIDDEEDMVRLVELGVDGVISNRPSVLASVLARLDRRWSGRERQQSS